MSVSGVGDSSLINELAKLASSQQADKMATDMQSVAYKQIKNNEEMQAELMAKLMESTPSVDPSVGSAVDLSI